jgi:XTP/dITP diphosphohydrolase
MKLLIATTNPSKFKEASASLSGFGFEVLSLKDFPGSGDVEETGATFEENALLKAKTYFKRTKMPCIADDGGIVVDALDGAPGVASHRWLGDDATDEDRANGILERMKGVPREKRTARIGGIIVFFDGVHTLKAENWLEGYISDRVMGDIQPGFPYRHVLIIPQFGKAYSELTEAEHEAVSFRRKSIRELAPQIAKLLKQA